MELRLKELGTIEITDATRVEGDDILIKSANGFSKIAEITGHEIAEMYLAETDFKWALVVWLKIHEDIWDEDDTIVLQIENQDDVYKLNALL